MHPNFYHVLSIVTVSLSLACTPPEEKSAGRAAPEGVAPQPQEPVKVKAAAAATEPIPRQLSLTGTLKASAESEIAANASGQVTRTYVERGSIVKKGALLVQLDKRTLALSAAEAEADLEATREKKKQADSECERNRRLFERHIITQEEFEKTESSCKVEQQTLAAAELKQRRTAVSLRNATVRAPFSGQVNERYVNVGEYVTPDTRVVRLVQSDPMRIELTVGELDVSKIRIDQTLEFEVKGIPDKTFTAAVCYIAPTLRAATRDLVFEAVTPNPDGTLKAGMFVTAQVVIGTENLVVVPKSALRKDGETTRAFIVKNGHLEERVVHVAEETGDRVAVKLGIAAGERFVTVVDENLKDGLAVVE